MLDKHACKYQHQKNDPRLDLEHFDLSTPTCTAILDRTRWTSLRQEQGDGGVTRRGELEALWFEFDTQVRSFYTIDLTRG